MASIVLSTLNARYMHAAFGLRYLLANMGALQDETRLMEFTIEMRASDIVEKIMQEAPSIVGLGVYIWNVQRVAEVVKTLRAIAPQVTLVVGGPEVSHEIEAQPWLADVDYIVTGEGDAAFPKLCERLLSGRKPLQRVIDGGAPEISTISLPYDLYDEEDIAHRVLYVEASRGCPFRCEFCLSSLDKKVRAFDLPEFLTSLENLMDRGARSFKFVDRTFNLDIQRSEEILRFFLDRIELGLFIHFEMVPDRLPERLRELIRAFPEGSLQFEIGIQSFDPEVGQRIQRRQNLEKTFDNLRFLCEDTGVHLHTDLIIGLPGEDLASFGAGLDRLIRAGVQEVQVGVLKRLRGTPIARHSEEFALVFDQFAPYAILSTAHIDFPTMQRLKRFSLVWDVFWNRGTLLHTMALMWGEASPFEETLKFSDWLFQRDGKVHAMALKHRARRLAEYMQARGDDDDAVLEALTRDFAARGSTPPPLLEQKARATGSSPTPTRQRRHLSQ